MIISLVLTGDGGGGKIAEGLEHRLPKYRKTDSDNEEEGEGDAYGDDLYERRGRRRERLYRGTFLWLGSI